MNPLICIIGPDGTGKSTQANLLIKSLKKEGIDFEYRWLRFHHLFSLPILGLARLMGLSKVIKLKNGEKIGYHYFYKSKFISSLYEISLLLDTIIFTILKLYVPIYILKKNIVSDRFIYDTLIDLMISTSNYNKYNSNLGKVFLKLIPEKSITVLLISNEKTLRSRRNDVFYDETLKLKIKLYQQFAEIFEISTIEANSPIEIIQEKLILEIKQLIK